MPPFPCGWPVDSLKRRSSLAKDTPVSCNKFLCLCSVPHRLCPRFSPEEQPSKRQRKGVVSAAGDWSANGATAEASKKVNFSSVFFVKNIPCRSRTLSCGGTHAFCGDWSGYTTSEFQLATCCFGAERLETNVKCLDVRPSLSIAV